MNSMQQLHWPLIIGMGALALIRPLLNITGLLDGLGRPFGPLLISVLISLAWLVLVVLVRAHRPLLTLVWTGITYGIFAILLSAILSPLLDGRLSGPITNPLAMFAVLITNAIWGGVVGAGAWVILRVTGPKPL